MNKTQYRLYCIYIHLKARRNTFNSVDEMITFYTDRTNNLHTAFPALMGQLGAPIYKSKGRISAAYHQYTDCRCFIIHHFNEKGNDSLL